VLLYSVINSKKIKWNNYSLSIFLKFKNVFFLEEKDSKKKKQSNNIRSFKNLQCFF